MKILKDAYSQHDTERKVVCFLFAEFYAGCLIFVDEVFAVFFMSSSFLFNFFSIIFPSFFISLFFFLLHNKCRKKWREREREGERERGRENGIIKVKARNRKSQI